MLPVEQAPHLIHCVGTVLYLLYLLFHLDAQLLNFNPLDRLLADQRD